MSPVEKRKIGLLFSGGKDSTYACAKMLEQGHDVKCLVTIISTNKSSYMLHTADIELTRLSSEALEIPLIKGYTKGRKEEELEDIEKAILHSIDEYGIDAVGTGAIASIYQKERIDSIAAECGLSVISPLWQTDQVEYMHALQSEGFRYIITSVSSEGLDRDWLGREVSESDLFELIRLSQKFRFNVAFEGGEAETFVLDCPIFRSKRIKVLQSSITWNGYFGEYEIQKATLENKEVYCGKRV
jgi:diphthine-ammonia ligase